MPPVFTNPAYVPPPADGSGVTFSLLEVANQAGRLSLPQASALGRAIKQYDDGSIWALKPGGLASAADDWARVTNFPFAFLEVADAAARLALPQVSAVGRAVRQADENSVWSLVPNGIASAADDWVCLIQKPPVGLIRKVALAGDSHFNTSLVTGTTTQIAMVESGFGLFAAGTFQVVRPPRDRFTHSVGGSTVDFFLDGHPNAMGLIRQKDELFVQLGERLLDTVVLSLGTNDRIGNADQNAKIERLRTEFVLPFTAAGGVVVLSCIPPARNRPDLGADYATLEEDALAWNNRLKSVFSGMRNVVVYDCSPLFSEPETPSRIVDEWLSDGIHLTASGNLRYALGLIGAITQHALVGSIPEDTDWEWITANPHSLAASTPQYQATQIGYFSPYPTVTYVDRADGVANERIACVNAPVEVQMITGASHGSIRYDLVPAGKVVQVEHVADVGATEITFEVTGVGADANGYKLLTVKLPASDATTVTATSTQVVAAITANPVIAALVTPTQLYSGIAAKLGKTGVIFNLGAGAQGVSYLYAPGQIGKSIFVNHNCVVGLSEMEIVVATVGNSSAITVRLPSSNGTTTPVLASAVIAAFNAHPAASALMLARPLTDASGTAWHGTAAPGSLKCNADDLDNVDTISANDVLRGYAEVLPEPGEEFLQGMFYLEMGYWNGTAFVPVTYGNANSWYENPFPMPDSGKLVMTTPWVTVDGTKSKYSCRIRFMGVGQWRAQELGVQRAL